jgi:tetratricopeptide (TPR) repeat protein
MPSEPRAILILGMHRSGTSCLAGMLAAGGLASAGEMVRNWDNARGHHEMLDVVRLNEAVLAYSDGHWLSPPATVRWTADHADARDRLLRSVIDGRPALIKDPRTLLVLPFWRASEVPYHVIAIVRHPLAVARSLESWRGMPLSEGVALWTAHNRALAADRAEHDYELVDFEAPKDAVVATVLAACVRFGATADAANVAAAYEEDLVHHDDMRDAETANANLDEVVALYRQLARAPRTPGRARRVFPRQELATFSHTLSDKGAGAALPAARAALASVADAASVLVPVVTSLLRHRAHAEALALIEEHAARLDVGLADLLRGKVRLAMGDAEGAASALSAACGVPLPLFQARSLLPQALRGAGRRDEARAAMLRLATEALYPHRPLATIAEWSWLDGQRQQALADMQRAIEAAPPHRRGRLRTRRAEWLQAQGDRDGARHELRLAIEEDPGYARSRELLQREETTTH